MVNRSQMDARTTETSVMMMQHVWLSRQSPQEAGETFVARILDVNQNYPMRRFELSHQRQILKGRLDMSANFPTAKLIYTGYGDLVAQATMKQHPSFIQCNRPGGDCRWGQIHEGGGNYSIAREQHAVTDPKRKRAFQR